MAGVINAYTAMLAERAGFRALYLSGSGVATASFGLPDLGLTTLTEVAEEVRRITAALRVFAAIRADGTQAAMLPAMQTRAELYDVLDYEAHERQADLRAAAKSG